VITMLRGLGASLAYVRRLRVLLVSIWPSYCQISTNLDKILHT